MTKCGDVLTVLARAGIILFLVLGGVVMRWWSLQVRWGMNADTFSNEVPEMAMESHLLSQ